MSAITSLDHADPGDRGRQLLNEVERQLGRTPNLYRSMAHSPATLAGYLALRGELVQGSLTPQMAERIALLTAVLNGCDYCVAAHCFRGAKAGLSADELTQTEAARSEDPKTDAALKFVAALIDNRGRLDDELTTSLDANGWTPEEIGEMVGHVALNVLSNYFNHIAKPALDFPEPRR